MTTSNPPPRHEIKELIVAAANTFEQRDRSSRERSLRRLDEISTTSDGRLAVDEEIAACLAAAIALAWCRGWQPADVARAAGRHLGSEQAALTVDVIAIDRRRYEGRHLDPRWQVQLDELAAEVWWREDRSHLAQWQERHGLDRALAILAAIALLSLLWTLPTLPQLGPLPGEEPKAGRPARAGDRAVDSRMLARVRALLAKAESTTFPEEAEALSAKAQELMARHMIDRVMLDQADGVSTSEQPMGVRVSIDDPYANAKSHLLHGVALANRCRAVYAPALGFSTLLGHEIDIDTVELLYSSLLVQATTAMVAAGRHVDWAGRSRTRSFRQSFLLAYANRIAARLKEANQAMVAEAEAGANLLPILASRENAVEEAVAKVFPRLSRNRASASNQAGWAAGTAAANVASLRTSRAEVRS